MNSREKQNDDRNKSRERIRTLPAQEYNLHYLFLFSREFIVYLFYILIDIGQL
jgi:hypothetical protein